MNHYLTLMTTNDCLRSAPPTTPSVHLTTTAPPHASSMKSTLALLSFATLSTLASSATFDVDVEMMVADALASSKGVASGSPLLGHRRKLGASGKYAVLENFRGKACTSTKNVHQLVHLDECLTFTTGGQAAALAFTQMAVNKVGMSIWLSATCTGTAALTNLMADSTCAAALNPVGQNMTAISPYTLKDSDVMFDLYVTVPTRDLEMSVSLLFLSHSTHGSRVWACVHSHYFPLTAALLPFPICLLLRSHTRTGTLTALARSTSRSTRLRAA